MRRRGVLLAVLLGASILGAVFADEVEPKPGEEESEQAGTQEEPSDEEAKARRDEVSKYSYCKEENCYDVLGLKDDVGPLKIKRAYRRLAAEWHPDKNPDPKAKQIFQRYANAYSVLSDSVMKANYDYLLAHPYEFPMHFLRYGSVRYAPKSDLRTVLVLVVLAISGIQFFFVKQRRSNVLQGIKGTRAYQERLKVLLSTLDSGSAKAGKPRSGSTKGRKEGSKDDGSGKKAEAEAMLLAELESDLPPLPTLHDTFAFVIFCSPLTFTYMFFSYSGWFVRFTLLRQAYGAPEKAYLTMKALGLTASEWEKMDETEREALFEQELWVADNMEAYTEDRSAAGSGGSRTNKEKRAIRARKKGVETSAPLDD
jgi:DnaJ family protein C protein 25